MRKFTAKAIALLSITLFMLSCSGSRVLQAPAFYVAPVPAETAVQLPEREKISEGARLGEPRLPPPLPTGGDTIPLPEPALDSSKIVVLKLRPVESQQAAAPAVPLANLATRQVYPPDSLKTDTLLLIDTVQETVNRLPAMPEEMLPEEELIPGEEPMEEEPETEAPETEFLEEEAPEVERSLIRIIDTVRQEVRIITEKVQPGEVRQEREIMPAEEVPARERSRAAPDVPELQRQQRSLQLLEEQNGLLRQQLQSMQEQQLYYQQQNERLLTLALANRSEEPEAPRVISQPAVDTEYPVADLPADSVYRKMEERVMLLNKQVAALQLALDKAAIPDMLAPAKEENQPDTALLQIIASLQEQVSALQQAQADSVPLLEPLNVYFASGASKLAPEDLEKLRNWLMQTENLSENFSIVLNGYTDKSGPADLNLRLANKRIQAVKAALIELGIPQSRILSGYMGIDLQQQDLAHARRVQLLVKP